MWAIRAVTDVHDVSPILVVEPVGNIQRWAWNWGWQLLIFFQFPARSTCPLEASINMADKVDSKEPKSEAKVRKKVEWNHLDSLYKTLRGL